MTQVALKVNKTPGRWIMSYGNFMKLISVSSEPEISIILYNCKASISNIWMLSATLCLKNVYERHHA